MSRKLDVLVLLGSIQQSLCDKIVNTKLFNNGKFVHAGSVRKEHARITTKIILERIQNMEHEVEYYVPDNFNGKHL